MKKTPHPYGKGKVPIATTIPAAADADLRAQAADAGTTRGDYARRLIVRGLRDPLNIIEISASEQAKIYRIPENPTTRAAEPPPA
jgi:hypothetical protein